MGAFEPQCVSSSYQVIHLWRWWHTRVRDDLMTGDVFTSYHLKKRLVKNKQEMWEGDMQSTLQLLNLLRCCAFSNYICLKFFRDSLRREKPEGRKRVWSRMKDSLPLLSTLARLELIWIPSLLLNGLAQGGYRKKNLERASCITLLCIKVCPMHNSVHLVFFSIASHSRWMRQLDWF